MSKSTSEPLRAAESRVPEIELPPQGLNLKQYVAVVESRLIQQALERTHGVVADAAKLLGLQRTTLVEKLRKYRKGIKSAGV